MRIDVKYKSACMKTRLSMCIDVIYVKVYHCQMCEQRLSKVVEVIVGDQKSLVSFKWYRFSEV